MQDNDWKAKPPNWLVLVGLVTAALLGGVLSSRSSQAATAPVNLGTAANFAILAGSQITNVPTSVVVGDVGLHPASGAFIGISCGEVAALSTIYSVDAFGPLPCRVTNPTLLNT